MNDDNKEKALTVHSFRAMKQKGRKIVMLTAYDFAMARAVSQAEVDLILVGDSLGMVVLGYDSTLQVTLEDMIYHTQAVRRGAEDGFIIADMPYMSYHLSWEETKLNAARLIVNGGANAVKLEGGSPARLDAIKAILDCEIPVCAHLGLTPQSIYKFGGYKVQGKTAAAHDALYEQALKIEQAGAFLLVLEGIPEELGKAITDALKIPVIGIGAGRYCDGQVLVFHDLLGWSTSAAKFVKTYADTEKYMITALNAFAQDVRSGTFPARENVYYPID
ncbi:MAG TPA: 3-methyl-2-oxobutanoate hydroxymethyltransferase [Candidatus Cloacimonadota bacterium]|nr:3-methyl-2-oxobutanoate hydroxymethyltransferase [Candidatus Cloacimonadota bacterium]HQL15349.1 3-methyl-2-oxobutanoate hydroxymethyltransferase [Candidatus Cloacimonadota bacterium]